MRLVVFPCGWKNSGVSPAANSAPAWEATAQPLAAYDKPTLLLGLMILSEKSYTVFDFEAAVTERDLTKNVGVVGLTTAKKMMMAAARRRRGRKTGRARRLR